MNAVARRKQYVPESESAMIPGIGSRYLGFPSDVLT